MRWLVGLFVVALWAGAIVPLQGLVAQNSEATAAELPYEQTRGFEQSARVYEYAAATAPCAVDWTVLGGIANVASDHGRVGGAQRLRADGVVTPPVLGLPLDGNEGRALMADTDGGLVDGVADFDRAVGPFQFIPATWTAYRTDGNGDGVTDPHNLWDAAASAAALLCDTGIVSEPASAISLYFGGDEWSDSVDDARADLLELAWSTEVGGSPFAGLAHDLVVSDTVQVGVAAPVATDQTLSDQPLSGDWNGDGFVDSAVLVEPGVEAIDPNVGRRLLFLDHEGLPYGRAIEVTRSLITAGLRPTDAKPVVSDWNGDGLDDIGLVTIQDGIAALVTFARDGSIEEIRPVGLAEAGTSFQVVERMGAALTRSVGGVGGEYWETVTIADRSALTLNRVGNIVVAESISGQLAEMIAHAAADGIALDGWGWRSHEQQISLRAAHCADIWTTPASECSPPTAAPGTSRHEYGLAIDFHAEGAAIGSTSPEFQWLSQHAATYGFFNLPSEPWHWSIDGG